MNIKAYIPKSLPSLPTIPAFDKFNKTGIAKILGQLDIRALLIGLSTVFLFYALAFAYVALQSSATIANLESQLPSTHVAITKIEAPVIHHEEDNHIPVHNDFLIDGLSHNTNAGELPIIRKSDYLTSFRAYQAPFTHDKNSKKPVIAFIVKDYGLSAGNSRAAADTLPAEISFMLSPYANEPSKWLARAQNKGHEIWMHLPVQNAASADLGPYTVFHHASLSDKQNAIYATMSKTLGYVGLAGYTDEGLSSAKDNYVQLFDELYSRGLGYLELNPDASQLIYSKAFMKGAPYIKADLEVFAMKGESSFESLERIAQDKGHAVAVIPNYAAAIKNLRMWVEKVGHIDYQIAPISTIYDLPPPDIAPSELQSDDLIEPEEEHHH